MKRKLRMLTVLVGLVMVLGACGTNPKSQFLKQLVTMSDTKDNAGTVEVKIADLEMSQETSGEAANNPMMGMIMSQIKGISLTGDFVKDAKKPENFKADMALNVMGGEFPLKMIGSFEKEAKLYMGLDEFVAFMEMGQMFGGTSSPSLTGLEEIKGKYIDVMEMQEPKIKQAPQADPKDMEKVQAFSKAYMKELAKYMTSLDKKTFTKKDDVLTHTFSKEEILGMLELTQKVAKSDKKFADYVVDEEADLKELFKDFKDFSVKVQLNTKTNASKIRLTMEPTESNQSKAGFKKVALDVVTTSRTSKESVEMPTKKEVLTKEEIAELAPQPEPASLGQVSDEEFKQLLDNAEAVKATISEDQIKQALESNREYLTEEQYNELEKALK